MRVLVVDDSAEFIRAVVVFLGTLRDVEFVGQALTGQHGLRMAETLEPDLVLVDWMMPGMSGPDSARAIKTLPHAPKVVLLSLLNGPELVRSHQRWHSALGKRDLFLDRPGDAAPVGATGLRGADLDHLPT